MAFPTVNLDSTGDESGVPVRKMFLGHVDTAKAILEVARFEKVDLIVIGAHGDRGMRLILNQGLERNFLGRTVEQVLRHAPCSVLKVGIGWQESIRGSRSTMLVLEGDNPGEEILEWTAGLATAFDTSIEILQVQKPEDYSERAALDVQEKLDMVRESLIARTNLPVDSIDTLLARGNPARIIRATAQSRSCILIIQEAHPDDSAELLGETAAEIARTVPAAVLTVRSGHFDQTLSRISSSISGQ